MNKIAITIQNYVQYYSVDVLIKELMKDNIVHIYVPVCTFDEGFNNMYDDIYGFLVKFDCTVYREEHLEIKYKIVLQPDNMDNYFKFNYDYRIKYDYYVMSSKPQLMYQPHVNLCFDAYLCHSVFEMNVLSIFAPTYLVGRLNYIGFKKSNKKDDKKILLYLPTYGDLNTIDDLLNEFSKLKNEYHLVIKLHHGTTYLLNEAGRKEKLNSVFDEVHDNKTKLIDLFKTTDIIVSDNSGSIFDALYVGIPVCIYSNNLKDCDYGDFESIQHQLVNKDIIPYTNKSRELKKVIDMALTKSYIDKQKKESKKLFPLSESEYLSSNMDVINKYLNDDVDLDRYKLRRIMSSYFYDLMDNNGRLAEEINLLNKNNEILKEDNERLNKLNESLSRTFMNRVADRYRHFKETNKNGNKDG